MRERFPCCCLIDLSTVLDVSTRVGAWSLSPEHLALYLGLYNWEYVTRAR